MSIRIGCPTRLSWKEIVDFSSRKEAFSKKKEHIIFINEKEKTCISIRQRFIKKIKLRSLLTKPLSYLKSNPVKGNELKEKTIEVLKELTTSYLNDSLKNIFRENKELDIKSKVEIVENKNRGLQRIHDDIFQENKDKNTQVTSITIAKTHKALQELLLSLEESIDRKTNKEQTIKSPYPDIFYTQNGEITILRKAPDKKSIALKGGGAKGNAYFGILEALEEHGIMQKVSKIAGTSAGALTALCYATGMDSKDFSKFNQELNKNQKAYLGGPARKFNHISIEKGSWIPKLGRTASNLVVAINLNISKNVYNILKSDRNKEILKKEYNKLSNLYGKIISARTYGRVEEEEKRDVNRKEILKKINTLKELMELSNVEEGSNKINEWSMTFSHLKIISDIIPDHKFKELVITGYNMESKKEIYFSAEHTPDMCISEAARVSMQIPHIFSPVKINGISVADGGALSNIPAETINPAFPSPNKNTLKISSCEIRSFDTGKVDASSNLIFAFDEGGKIEKQQRSSAIKPSGYVKALLSGLPIVRGTLLDNMKFHLAGLSGYIVYHGTMETLSFEASETRIEHAHTIAKARFLEQARLNGLFSKNTAISNQYASIDSAVESLSEEERKAILERASTDASYKEKHKDFLQKIVSFK